MMSSPRESTCMRGPQRARSPARPVCFSNDPQDCADASQSPIPHMDDDPQSDTPKPIRVGADPSPRRLGSCARFPPCRLRSSWGVRCALRFRTRYDLAEYRSVTVTYVVRVSIASEVGVPLLFCGTAARARGGPSVGLEQCTLERSRVRRRVCSTRYIGLGLYGGKRVSFSSLSH